jgi:hypothetical protein
MIFQSHPRTCATELSSISVQSSSRSVQDIANPGESSEQTSYVASSAGELRTTRGSLLALSTGVRCALIWLSQPSC